jgi:hypothetical protein
VRVGRHGREGVDGRFRDLAVALVDLFLAVGALRGGAVRPAAGLGVERAVLALFAEEEEVGDLLVFLFREEGRFRDVVGLWRGRLVWGFEGSRKAGSAVVELTGKSSEGLPSSTMSASMAHGTLFCATALRPLTWGPPRPRPPRPPRPDIFDGLNVWQMSPH